MFIIDFETTGRDPRIHAPVSVAVVDYCNLGREPFYCEFRAWEGAAIDPEALRLNGFTEEQARRTNPFSTEEAMELLLRYIVGCSVKVPAGINTGRFDIPMAVEACQRVGLEWRYEKNTVDLHALVVADQFRRGVSFVLDPQGRSGLSGDLILQYTGLPLEPRPHHALTGAKMEAEALKRLLEGRSFFPEFERYKIPEYLRR